MQIRRRRNRSISQNDKVTLIVTLSGLFLFAISWGYFQHNLLHKEAYGRRGRDGRVGQAAVSAANLQTKGPRFCEEHFGMAWLRAWNATRHQVCRPAGPGATGPAGEPWSSTITCGTPDPDDHLPAASGPHMFCDATNLLLDPSKLQRARCPKYRPGYLCISRTYHHYLPGSWAAACDWPDFRIDGFSKDHMQDIFGGMVFAGNASMPDASTAAVEELPTLLVTREAQEHGNVFHTFTDLLNVYSTLRMLGWMGVPRQVLILDEHPAASLDLLWTVVAAGGGTEVLAQGGTPWQARLGGRRLVRRVEDIKAPVLFRHVAFVPPGYTSLLFAHLYEEASCRQPTELFAGFREFMLAPFGLSGAARAPAPGAPLTVRLISRRPSPARRRMARQIANEDALLGMLRQVAETANTARGAAGNGKAAASGEVQVSSLDLSELSLAEQLEVVTSTDMLIAMHGAALAYAILMPPHAAVVELWPQEGGIWRCYENMSLWAGILYRRLANADPAKHVESPTGDKTTVDVDGLRLLVEELVPLVQSRKAWAAGLPESGPASDSFEAEI